MKVTVNKYLNARIGEASTNATCKFYRMPGDTIEIDDVLVGTEIDGNSVWYHCKDDGRYYWSGGIEEVGFEIENVPVNEVLLFAVIKDIQNNYFKKFSKDIEGYTGCGIGHKNFNNIEKLSLIFYVTVKKTLIDIKNKAPEFITHKGLKIITDVVEMSNINLQGFKVPSPVNPDPDNFTPLNIGGKIYESGFQSAFGTRSLKVQKNNKPMLLSCCHVMAATFSSSSFPPQNIEKSNITVEITDRFMGTTHTLKVIEAGFDGNVDYALAELTEPPEMVRNFFNGKLITEFADEGDLNLSWHHMVESIGRSSGHQKGIILSTSTKITIGKITFHDIILTERLSTGGDSGAPVMKNDLFVGYIFGGDDVNFSYVIPFYKLKSICSILN